MAHGTKPYARTTPADTIFGVADMGELVTRLGSINTYDRRGNTVWFDDFESGRHMWAYGGTVGWASAWEGNHSRNGGFSCALTPGPGVGGTAFATHNQPVPVLGRCGVEMSWSHTTDHGYVELQLTYHDGALYHRAAIRYNQPLAQIEILTGLPVVWTGILAVAALGTDLSLFNTFKIVGDFVNDLYIRAFFNGNTIPIVGVPLVSAASGFAPVFDVIFTRRSAVVAAGVAYHDDCIMTQNEP